MDFDKLYKIQEELNQHIWDKHGTLDKMSKEELLDSTILALLVEVGCDQSLISHYVRRIKEKGRLYG